MKNYLFIVFDAIADFITGKVHGEFAMSKHRTSGDTTMLICIMLGVLGIVGLLFVLLSGA